MWQSKERASHFREMGAIIRYQCMLEESDKALNQETFPKESLYNSLERVNSHFSREITFHFHVSTECVRQSRRDGYHRLIPKHSRSQ